jgi:stress response protein YsnF
MTKTIVAMYERADEAERAYAALGEAGLPVGEITVVGHGSDAPAAADAGSAGLRRDIPGIGGAHMRGPDAEHIARDPVDGLEELGVPSDDAHSYAEGVRRGSTLLVMRASDSDVPRAMEVLERHRPVDIDSRAAGWRTTGWSRFEREGGPWAAEDVEAERVRYAETGLTGAADRMRGAGAADEGEETRIPVAEEDLAVGKHAERRGTVRVHTRVREVPVEETVALRDEHVRVERRPAGGSVAPGEDPFRERTVEVTETDEVADVSKRVRAAEEVVVRKDVDVKRETVRDTVRKTEVDVEGAPDADDPARRR